MEAAGTQKWLRVSPYNRNSNSLEALRGHGQRAAFEHWQFGAADQRYNGLLYVCMICSIAMN
jgi:hypothetical protein